MSTPASGELTTTSYAILGLLAVQPWSTYELARQMDRALGWFWPRTRSKLYEEPKKLVAAGLAKATTESVGRRKRTVYSITAKGRRAIARWASTPRGGGPVLEFEQLVKVFFAEHGSKEDLLATLAELRTWLEERAMASQGIPHEYLEGRGPYPERLPWLILTGRFLDEFDSAVERWLDWATDVVRSWPDDIRTAESDWEALAAMAQRVDAILERRARRLEASPASPVAVTRPVK
jgi:DNA-binding PadR family transcriptional regulator